MVVGPAFGEPTTVDGGYEVYLKGTIAAESSLSVGLPIENLQGSILEVSTLSGKLTPVWEYDYGNVEWFSIRINGDYRAELGDGYCNNKCKLTQGGTTKYFRMFYIYYNSGGTYCALYGAALYSLTSSAISNEEVSFAESPRGFPRQIIDDGWIPRNYGNFIYTSANKMYRSGDARNIYRAGQKIKLYQSSTLKYFKVLKVTYSGGNTTLLLDGGLSYSLANASIHEVITSDVNAPDGWPEYNFIDLGWNFVDETLAVDTHSTQLFSKWKVAGKDLTGLLRHGMRLKIVQSSGISYHIISKSYFSTDTYILTYRGWGAASYNESVSEFYISNVAYPPEFPPKILDDGWIPSEFGWSCDSIADDPIYVISTDGVVNSDLYTPGTRVMVQETSSSAPKYYIVHKIETSGSYTKLYIFGGTDSDISAAGAMFGVAFSPHRIPRGFVSDKSKWAYSVSLSAGSQSNPVKDTWYDLTGGSTVYIPVGQWEFVANWIDIELTYSVAKTMSSDIKLCSSADGTGTDYVIFVFPFSGTNTYHYTVLQHKRTWILSALGSKTRIYYLMRVKEDNCTLLKNYGPSFWLISGYL